MKYPKSEQYDKQFLLENMMGPNALKILEELTEGIKLTSDMKFHTSMQKDIPLPK